MIKEQYKVDGDLHELLEKFYQHPQRVFHIDQGFLFKESRLCILRSGIKELLIQEVHGGALAGHYRIDKTRVMLEEHYHWPKMARDVEHFVKRC